MRLSSSATLVLTGIAAVAPAHAHYYGGGQSLVFPRRTGGRNYRYSRSPTTDAFDMVLDFIRTPIYAGNSILRQSEAFLDELSRTTGNPRHAIMENKETGTIELAVELPGVSAKDLIVELEDNHTLRIRGFREYPQSLWTEFDQSFPLDEDIDPSSLKVTMSSGILRVTGARKQKVFKRLEVETSGEENVNINMSQQQDKPLEEKQHGTVNTEDDSEELTITEEDP